MLFSSISTYPSLADNVGGLLRLAHCAATRSARWPRPRTFTSEQNGTERLLAHGAFRCDGCCGKIGPTAVQSCSPCCKIYDLWFTADGVWGRGSVLKRGWTASLRPSVQLPCPEAAHSPKPTQGITPATHGYTNHGLSPTSRSFLLLGVQLCIGLWRSIVARELDDAAAWWARRRFGPSRRRLLCHACCLTRCTSRLGSAAAVCLLPRVGC